MLDSAQASAPQGCYTSQLRKGASVHITAQTDIVPCCPWCMSRLQSVEFWSSRESGRGRARLMSRRPRRDVMQWSAVRLRAGWGHSAKAVRCVRICLFTVFLGALRSPIGLAGPFLRRAASSSTMPVCKRARRCVEVTQLGACCSCMSSSLSVICRGGARGPAVPAALTVAGGTTLSSSAS